MSQILELSLQVSTHIPAVINEKNCSEGKNRCTEVVVIVSVPCVPSVL